MKIVVVGSTGLIGKYVYHALSKFAEVIGVSRSTAIPVDVNNPQSISEMYKKIGKIDAVASCIGKVPFKSITQLSYEDYRSGMTDKALGQVELVRQGIDYMNDSGSFTLMTGILARKPIPTGTVASFANGAIESFTKAAAIELPRGIRINTISPSVLVEAESYHPFFPEFHQVSADEVAHSYVEVIQGAMTGKVIELN
jgi:NAD(P)-dependent dehydrogenase (short-subunit alcohol dehydrogenase family)